MSLESNPNQQVHNEAEWTEASDMCAAGTDAHTDVNIQTALEEITKSLDGQSYLLGEVPQSYLMDPQAFLPLNSDRLAANADHAGQVLGSAQSLIDQELAQIQKWQLRMGQWESKIGENKGLVAKQEQEIQDLQRSMLLDKRNQDYWTDRAEQVRRDFIHAQASNRESHWQRIVKKYGLKQGDGAPLTASHACIEELTEEAMGRLELEFRRAAEKYSTKNKDKETLITRKVRDNAAYLNRNEELQVLVQHVYQKQVEPLQEGVLLLKEFQMKYKNLADHASLATYGDLREWAEAFLDQFLGANPQVSESLVVEFRQLASIPLPSQNR
jgi:hypothetical protein